MVRSQMQSKAGAASALTAMFVSAALALSALPALAQEKAFTIEQALSAPFTSDLIVAPAKGRLA
jgi:hypothetical protein